MIGLCTLAPAELMNVIVISRHGTRAPNPEVLKLCPNDIDNLMRYNHLHIAPAGLTGNGMSQLFALGEYTRRKYIGGGHVSKYYDGSVYVRAVAEERTVQSAVAWGHALYPSGSAPLNYLSSYPEPLPVYTVDDKTDNLLESRKNACKKRLKQDISAWDTSAGPELYREHSDVISRIEQLCGVRLTPHTLQVAGSRSFGDALKDISDALTFDYMEGLPMMPGLTEDLLQRFREVAFTQLRGRLYGTAAQHVYLSGGLPDEMVRIFREAAEGSGAVKKMNAYHGHREMLYAIGEFFGLNYEIVSLGVPKGAVPPAATLFFELHRRSPSESPYVQVHMWVPCEFYQYNNSDYRQSAQQNDCNARQLTIRGCGAQCPLERFIDLVNQRIAGVGGDYVTLCSADTQLHTVPSSQELENDLGRMRFTIRWLTAALIVMSCVAAAFGYCWMRQRSESGYEPLPSARSMHSLDP